MALERRQGADRIEYILVECPACGDDLRHAAGLERSAHIGSHDPEDFGLSPLVD